MTEYWFKPKRYGYGATPVTWQGWASAIVAAIAMLAVVRLMIIPLPGGMARSGWEIALGFALEFAIIVGFSLFAKTKTAGGWAWRWGKNSK